MTRLAIFDLDGTLLNTIGDLAVSCNAVLALRGLPQHSYEDYCRFVGNGIMRLVERALPEALRTPYTVDAVRRDFVAYYLAHIDEHTLPYEGIPELLDELQRRGVRLAVASNKFQAGTEKLIGRYFPDIRFDVVLGQRPDVPLKPDPATTPWDAGSFGSRVTFLGGNACRRAVGDAKLKLLSHWAEEWGCKPAEVLYVGDSGVDMQTAAAAGVRSAGVTWGFRTRAELEQSGARHIVDRPAELLGLL